MLNIDLPELNPIDTGSFISIKLNILITVCFMPNTTAFPFLVLKGLLNFSQCSLFQTLEHKGLQTIDPRFFICTGLNLHSIRMFHFKYNHFLSVMDSMLTLSVIHLGFEPQSGETKAKTIQLKFAAAPLNTQH